MGSSDSLADLARPVLAAAGLELWDVEITSSLVRVLVDRPGGVDLDAVAAAGSALAPVLDAHDELLPAGRFDLEVSSPGIERTLRTPEHFRRSGGALLNVKTRTAVDGSRRLRGTLAGSDDEGIELLPDGADAPIRLPLADIDRARVVFEWGVGSSAPVPKRGKKAPKKAGGPSSPASKGGGSSPAKNSAGRKAGAADSAGRETGAADSAGRKAGAADVEKGNG